MDHVGFIGVHVGAGKYSSESDKIYERLCRIACTKGVEVLNSGGNALDAVTVATAVLEDSELTNAGYGSNLTIDGNVECDAGVMNGSDLNFGAVGAVTGIKNPVLLAKKICCNQNERMELGRIPPCVVVGGGAYELSRKYSDILTVFPESLITSNALKQYNRFRKQLQDFKRHSVDLCDRLDTVGAVAVDKRGTTAAACSSGGILLKQPGRIGQAAMYGCGCWAEDNFADKLPSVAVTTSGCGEHLMKTMLAREIAEAMKKSTDMPCVTLNRSINEVFLESPRLKNVDEKLCGLLVLKTDSDGGEFLWAHSTPAMCIGYADTVCNKPKSRMSKLPTTVAAGKTVVVEGLPIQ